MNWLARGLALIIDLFVWAIFYVGDERPAAKSLDAASKAENPEPDLP